MVRKQPATHSFQTVILHRSSDQANQLVSRSQKHKPAPQMNMNEEHFRKKQNIIMKNFSYNNNNNNNKKTILKMNNNQIHHFTHLNHLN